MMPLGVSNLGFLYSVIQDSDIRAKTLVDVAVLLQSLQEH